MNDISIIIINYNTAEYTLECIKSVFKNTNTSIHFQIVVIDNNSNKDDFHNLENGLKYYENLILHRSPINTGFGGGNMLGVQFTKAKYLLFLNNDAFLRNDCLSLLLTYMENESDVGVCTAQNFDENDKPVPSFDHDKGIRKLLFGRSFLEKKFPDQYPNRKKKYREPVAVNYINGAFMFFRASTFAKVGGFDTNIFLYFEEMDICYRMRQIHFKSILFPQAEITHYQGASTGRTSKKIRREGLISYLYVIKKNHSYFKYFFIRFYFLVTFIFKPKKWFLWLLVFKGINLSESLKQQQELQF